jgi:hypothetical protein
MNTEKTTLPSFRLHRDPWGQLVLTFADGRQFKAVEPARAFPISHANQFISICDAEGHEILLIEKLSELPADVLAILNEELARREFMPVVLQIQKVLADTDPSEWHIKTDRGPTTFLMNDSDDDVRRLGPFRAILVDTHGIHYLIPDTRNLDAASRRTLDRYL